MMNTYSIITRTLAHWLDVVRSDQQLANCIIIIALLDIMNRKARLAWELYLRLNPDHTDAFSLLQIIANDCYKVIVFQLRQLQS
jgi:hypothetical protein